MKKFLSLVLVLAMVFSLAACGNNQPPAQPETPDGETPETPGIADSLTLHVGAYPDTIDPALNSAVDGATFQGLPCTRFHLRHICSPR
jgi:predicted small lipoprotein YifL